MRVVFLLTAAIVALAAADGRELRSSVSPLPERLVRLGRTAALEVIPRLDFALVSRDYEGLQRALHDRADPDSPRYAQWLSESEVTAFAAASDEAVAAVTAWLQVEGLTPGLNNHRDYITVRNVKAITVERLFQAQLYDHKDKHTGAVVPRIPGGYSLPAVVAPHVEKVYPVHSVPPAPHRPKIHAFTPKKGGGDTASWPFDCKDLKHAGMITPAVTRARYNYSAISGKSTASIAAMLPSPMGLPVSDIAYIQENCGLPNHPLDKFIGKNKYTMCKENPDDCFEPEIDSQIISTTAVGLHTEFWTSDCADGFVCLFKSINDAGDSAPRVFSFSFGDPENSREDDQHGADKEFAKASAQGITLVAASGDCGPCEQKSFGKKKYVATYPPSSQYVLGVGSTEFTQEAVIGEEMAVRDGFSSGGISALWARPSWQQKAVADYFNSGVKLPSATFNRTGRGTPDVSALGINFQIHAKDSTPPLHSAAGDFPEPKGWASGDGTSASGPLVASLVAKLNAARQAKGMGTMGWIHPWLYGKAWAVPGALNDITKGCNEEGIQGGTLKPAFYAAKGWDPVTGLGTPNYGILEEVALSTNTRAASGTVVI